MINGDQDISGDHNLGDSTVATRGQIDGLKQPHVANRRRRKATTRGQTASQGPSAKIINLAERRANRQQTQQPELATRGKTLITKKTRKGAGDWYIEPVKASAGTWAFRLRRRENGKRSKPIYIRRVANSTYEMIRGGDYESFKEQLVESYLSRTIRASHIA